MNHDRLDHLFQHCADVGLEVEWADLGERRRGEYHRAGNLIVLNKRLTRRQATACLAHEIAHATFGDACSTPPIERRAWEYAAAFLISPQEYADAERIAGHDLGSLAMELGVTPKLVDAWRRWWLKRGQHRVDVSTLDLCREGIEHP